MWVYNYLKVKSLYFLKVIRQTTIYYFKNKKMVRICILKLNYLKAFERQSGFFKANYFIKYLFVIMAPEKWKKRDTVKFSLLVHSLK